MKRALQVGMIVLATTALAGCLGGTSGPTATSAAGSSGSSSLFTKILVEGTTKDVQVQKQQVQSLAKCPKIEIRSGTESFTSYARGGEGDPTQLLYQAQISRTARECNKLAGQLLLKVGVAGRVILGPAGRNANVVVPLRIVVLEGHTDVRESKFYEIPVRIEAPETSALFAKVEEKILLDTMVGPGGYKIIVGFDTAYAKRKKRR